MLNIYFLYRMIKQTIFIYNLYYYHYTIILNIL